MVEEREKEGLTELERLRNNIEDKAKDIFRRYTYYIRPNALLDDYYHMVRRVHERRQKLKQPNNKHIGKPLNSLSIKQFESDLRWYIEKSATYGALFKILVNTVNLGQRPLRKGNVFYLEEYRRRYQPAEDWIED